MDQSVQAIYERGVLKLLEPLDLPEHQRVTIIVHASPAINPTDELEAWHQVFAGLEDQDLQEIESIALNRTQFMRQEE